ncbi:hypothetical protein KDL45_07250, partial [bacterium]|nr:hypothetical protein [bacterium]
PVGAEFKKYTQSNGSVRFEDLPLDPGDKVAVRVKATGFLDTYEYNFTVGSEDNEFRVAEEKLVEDIDTFLIGYDLLPGRSFISGGVYWKNKDGVEEGVGCATVEPELTSVGDPGDLIYFDWNNVFKKRLPDTSRDYTAPGNSPEAYGTKPLSLYIDVNAQAGDYTMTTVTKYGLGKINTQKIPNLCANCFAIARIVFDTGDYSSNPTPNDCE